jgi:hypothetical protein
MTLHDALLLAGCPLLLQRLPLQQLRLPLQRLPQLLWVGMLLLGVPRHWC